MLLLVCCVKTVAVVRPQVLSVFLDTLIELVYLQSAELGDWLHILLPRLLTKAGGELLGSVANKVQKTLDVIR